MKRKQPNNPAPFTTVAAVETPKSNKERAVASFVKSLIRLGGVLLIGFSAALYMQLVPLAMVFIGGYIGIEPGLVEMNMDTMIWVFTGIAILIPMVYIFVKWVNYVWMRFVVNPTPFTRLTR